MWSGARIQEMAEWIQTNMPPEQHGSIKHKGIHTALMPVLQKLEDSMNPAMRAKEPYRFIGCADFSKAFDRIHGITAAQALSRFHVPPRIWRTLLAAWSTQQRWLCTPQHAPDAPDLCQALPQGDPMSPLGLIIPLAEATARIKVLTLHLTILCIWMTVLG